MIIGTRGLAVLVVLLTVAVAAVPAHSAPVLGTVEVETADSRLMEALRLLDVGEFEQAESVARSFVREHPESAPGLETLGAALAMRGRLDEAIETLEQAVRVNPQQATAFTKLGDIAVAMGREARAVEYYERAVQAGPGDRRAHQRLGLHYEAQGDVDRAISHFEHGVVGLPADYVGVRLNLARMYSLTGQHGRGIELLERWAGELDRRPEVHRALGGAYFGDGRHELAVRHLRAAVLLRPNDLAAFRVLGDALAAFGDVELALATYEFLVEESEAASFTINELGVLLQGLGRLDRAEAVFAEMVARFPEEADGYARLGSLYGFQRRYGEAVDVYRRGLEHQPTSPLLLRGASAAALRAGEPEVALLFSGQLRDLGVNTAADAFSRGMILEQMASPREATDAYREAIALAGDHWMAMNNIAVIHLRAGENSAGLELAERATAIAGEQGHVLHTLGWALHENGRADEAVQALRRAVELRPESAVTHYRLGRALIDSGDAATGHEHLRRALELDASFPNADDARALLSR